MIKPILTIAFIRSLIVALRFLIIEAELFNNPKTHDNGLCLILNSHAYDVGSAILRTLNLDDAGVIGDIKIPLTKQTYIVLDTLGING